MVGLKLVITGGALTAPTVTVNGWLLTTVFVPTVMEIGPVVAPAGTLATSLVVVGRCAGY